MKAISIYRNICIFLALTVFLSWIVWIAAYQQSSGSTTVTGMMSVLIAIGSFSPSVAAFILIKNERGWQGLKNFICRAVLLRLSGFSWIYLLIIPFVGALVAIIGKSRCMIRETSLLLEHPLYIIPALIVILLFGGPLGEEFGWRGYLLEKLNAVMDPFFSSLIIGIVWSFWQLPLFFIPGTVQNSALIVTFFLVTTMVSILMTLVYVRNKGSIGSVIIFHTLTNLTYGVFPIYASQCRTFHFVFILAVLTGSIVILERKIFFPSEENKFH